MNVVDIRNEQNSSGVLNYGYHSPITSTSFYNGTVLISDRTAYDTISSRLVEIHYEFKKIEYIAKHRPIYYNYSDLLSY